MVAQDGPSTIIATRSFEVATMREGMRRDVSTVEEARAVLDYFNGFHDGFMKRLTIDSRDEMHEDQSQSCTGVFDVEIEFAHYNYADGSRPLHPASQRVLATFHNVQDLFCDFREGFLGNTINHLSIHLASRRQGGTTSVETCLALHLARNFYLEEYRRFELRQSQLFTFTRATFREPVC